MKVAFHKLITCFLLSLAALPLIFSVYFQLSQSIIHDEMREELEKSDLVTIRVKTSALTWTETGREASVNGKMFDVEKFIVKGNEVQLTGLYDKDEDALITQLDNQEKNNSEPTGSTLVLKWFSCFSWIQDRESNDLFSAQNSCNNALLQEEYIQNPVLSCETPPPESCI